jgi:hypothetical protein
VSTSRTYKEEPVVVCRIKKVPTTPVSKLLSLSPDLELAGCEPTGVEAPIFNEQGRLFLVLKADRVTYTGTAPTMLTRPRVSRYDDKSNLLSYAEADVGTIVSGEGLSGMVLDTLTLSGNVIIRQYEDPLKQKPKETK